MADVYVTIAQADSNVVQRIGDTLELRAADPQQRAMLHAYLDDVPFPIDAQVLEIGCGTGAIARTLAGWPGVSCVTGIDPSPLLIDRARELSGEAPRQRFEVADGRDLPFEDDAFDVVVIHTALCHIPQPERVLAESQRVLRPRGWLAIFDGDYATTTVATGANDPLEACAGAVLDGLVHDPWLARRLPALVRAARFDVERFRSHGYVQTTDPSYMLSVVERGADLLVATGRVGAEMGAALKAEAGRRIREGTFFGHIAYVSLLARAQ